MAKSELVDVTCQVRKDDPTKKAIAVADGTTETIDGREREKWFWLPRSQIEVNAGDGTVTMPRWLAEEKGLV